MYARLKFFQSRYLPKNLRLCSEIPRCSTVNYSLYDLLICQKTLRTTEITVSGEQQNHIHCCLIELEHSFFLWTQSKLAFQAKSKNIIVYLNVIQLTSKMRRSSWTAISFNGIGHTSNFLTLKGISLHTSLRLRVGKLQPILQIQPLAWYFKIHELSLIFIFLKGCKKITNSM